jgi:uncharacterized protein (TIGR03437 family)
MTNAIRSEFVDTSIRFFVLLLCAMASSTAQPVVPVGGILNAGSYATAGQAHYGLAQGSIFAVFGTGLGTATAVQVSQYPLPGSQGLAGTSIRVTVRGVPKDAWMLYASTNQLLALLPSDTPTGDGTFTVTYLGQTSAPSPVRVVPGSFGIFTRSQNGRGRAILQEVQPNGDLVLNDLNESAHPGQTVILWGTGLGSVSGDESTGPLPGPNFSPQIYIGGQFVKALYAGRSGCCAGVDQISFVIPDSVVGCYVPLAVGTGAAGTKNVVGNYTTISITQSGNTCTDSGLSSDALAKFGSAGNLVVASAVLSRNLGKDAGIVAFLPFNPDRTFSAGSLVGLPPAGSCHVLHLNTDPSGDPSPTSRPFPLPSPTVIPIVLPDSQYFDAGSFLSLSGPLGNRQLVPTGLSPYFGALSASTSSSYLTSGTYTLDNGSGGRDVEGFRATIGFSPTLTWTNRPSGFAQISRQSPLAVTWAGGDPQRELVMINGTLSMQSLSNASRGLTATGFFTCVERVDAGQFNVPSFVLYGLPIDTGIPFLAGETTNAGVVYASLSVSSISRLDQNMFLAPGLDAGYLVWMDADTINVGFNF